LVERIKAKGGLAAHRVNHAFLLIYRCATFRA
jgi:hypothetical protein